MPAPVGNMDIGGRNPFTWAQFDALPRPIRDVLNYAPVNLGSQRAYAALMAGSLVAAVLRQEVALARRFQGEHVLMTYGPDHPQAPGTSCAA